MKINQLLAVFGITAGLLLAAGNVQAQNDNGGGPPGGGPPGGGPLGGGGPGGGNFDPAQFQQRIMDRVKEQLAFTNDTDWDAVKPLVQKVMDSRRELGAGGGMGRMFGGGRNGGGNQGGPGGGMFGQPSPEQEALQKALDDNAPVAQIKDLLAKYKASQKVKQAKLEEAQANLKKVLTVRQEAQAALLGLVN